MKRKQITTERTDKMEATRLPQPDLYQDEKGRKYFYDNAKYILITLVVLAHFISPLQSVHTSVKGLWNMINTLHMPAMIFISGFFAKSYIKKDGKINVQRPVTYIILYLAAQLAVGVFQHFMGIDVPLSIFYARESLWFLQCLAAWYIMLPVIDKFKPLWVMIAAVAFGFIIGYDSNVGHLASLSRMFVHFPFFLGGYYCTQLSIDKIFTKKAKIAAVIILISMFGISVVAAPHFSASIITCNTRYMGIAGIRDWPFLLRWCARALFYIAAFLLGISFLALVPRKKTFFTKLGSRTLQVYILHRFLYILETEYKWYEPFESWWGVLVMMLIAIVASYILSLKLFAYPFEFLQSIKITKFLKKED